MWGVEVKHNGSLTSALDGGEWSTSCSGCFASSEGVPSSHSVEGWMSIRAGLDAVAGIIPHSSSL